MGRAAESQNIGQHILLISDDPADRCLLEGALDELPDSQYDILHIESIEDACQLLSQQSFCTVLIDLDLADTLPVGSLPPALRSLTADLPVIALSNNADPEFAVEAIKHGAQDFLLRSETGHEQLYRVMRYAIERKKTERRLTWLAHFDALTELANRTLFTRRLDRSLLRHHRDKKGPAVVFLDLDGFKEVNDQFGHDAGDGLLKDVAQRLVGCVRASDTVARLGGDEFALLLDDASSFNAVISVAEKALASVAQPYRVVGQHVTISTSIGISMAPGGGETADELLKNADKALYRAKDSGKNTYQIYTDGMHSEMLQRLTLERDLRRALAREEFELFYQPIVDVETQTLLGAEALIRWYPGHGDCVVMPESFIGLAEETNLISSIGEWVFYTACSQAVAWRRAGLPAIRIGINLSARQFRGGGLTRMIRRTLDNVPVNASQIQLELTETMVMRDTLESSYILNELKAQGLKLAIDDFGTGYSSLSYLRDFPVDTLKIDRSFVRDMESNDDDAAITAAIIAMGHRLKKTIVAEGVETPGQLRILAEQGCDQVQGFLYSKPLRANDFAEFLGHHVSGNSPLIPRRLVAR